MRSDCSRAPGGPKIGVPIRPVSTTVDYGRYRTRAGYFGREMAVRNANFGYDIATRASADTPARGGLERRSSSARPLHHER
jgi:hypothetical protein